MRYLDLLRASIPVFAIGALALAANAPAHAQDAAAANDPVAEQMFPPELIMRHQRAIGLSEAQKSALAAEVKKAQSRLVDVQFELQRSAEPLVDLLAKERPDETQVLAQLDKVLAVERDFKRTQLALVVHLKNLLSAEQQRQLRELRASAAAGAAPRPTPTTPR